MISYLSPGALQQILLKVSLSAGLIASCSSPTAAAAAKRDGISAESLRGGNKTKKRRKISFDGNEGRGSDHFYAFACVCLSVLASVRTGI